MSTAILSLSAIHLEDDRNNERTGLFSPTLRRNLKHRVLAGGLFLFKTKPKTKVSVHGSDPDSHSTVYIMEFERQDVIKREKERKKKNSQKKKHSKQSGVDEVTKWACAEITTSHHGNGSSRSNVRGRKMMDLRSVI